METRLSSIARSYFVETVLINGINLWFQQKKVILKAKPILQETIVQLYSKSFPECITMADMGCSSGPNTFLPIWEVLEAIDESCRKLNRKPPILQVFLNDLPGNDFNSIFRSLPSFHKKLEEEMGGKLGPCFIAAMPGVSMGGSFHRVPFTLFILLIVSTGSLRSSIQL